MKGIIIDSEQEMLQLGEKIGERVKPGDLLFLSGDLGAGKTTLTKGIATGLKVGEMVTSPTFQLKKRYVGHFVLNHLDLYRIKNQSDIDLLEPDEIIEEGITVVEWGELLLVRLGLEYLEIKIEFGLEPTNRKILLNPKGARYLNLCEELV